MPDAELGGRKQKWRIDRANRLGPGDTSLLRRYVHDWELAYLKACRLHRPQDVAGFERMLAAASIGVLVQMPEHRPGPKFAAGWPEVPGGGWKPAPHGSGLAVVEYP